ncbi:integrase family protein [Methylorubrum extorquens CM4]|uniref:Integrase family protein n=1 Tax=Methylorubrum extorquens (strain CM4 / NCIMB 13688) TaxID=440085 RepID=B7KRK5_METC4|nr:integrase family protein [Methylorubrum extorquens CM4]
MPGRLPRFCVEDVDRHGNVRVYLRRKDWPKVRLPGVPWTEPFMEAYRAALNGTSEDKPRDRYATLPDTWKWLCQQYVTSARFKTLDPVTQRRRRALLEATYDEPTKPGAKTVFADFPLARLTPAAIRILRDRKADVPDGANNTVKAIRATFKWAVHPEVALASHNPARDVGYIATASEGFHTWSVDEVKRFVARHPLGSRAYLALCLLLFAGGRRSDAVLFGRQHLQGAWLRYTQHKGRNAKPMTLEVPVLPALRAAIEACPSQNLAFLVTERGKPFTSNGFGNWFKDRCREAGLLHCSAHGLRKAGATLAAENGATERQLMAMFGWRTSKMAEHYTRKAEQKRLAGGAMHLINFDRSGEGSVPLFAAIKAGGTISGETATKSTSISAIGAQERTRTFTSCKTGT